MNIYTTDTGETITLVYAPTGCDCLRDISADDDCIKYNADEERYEADTTAIEWWADWVARSQEADSLQETLAETVGTGAAMRVSEEACAHMDLGDQPAARIAALTASIDA